MMSEDNPERPLQTAAEASVALPHIRFNKTTQPLLPCDIVHKIIEHNITPITFYTQEVEYFRRADILRSYCLINTNWRIESQRHLYRHVRLQLSHWLSSYGVGTIVPASLPRWGEVVGIQEKGSWIRSMRLEGGRGEAVKVLLWYTPFLLDLLCVKCIHLCVHELGIATCLRSMHLIDCEFFAADEPVTFTCLEHLSLVNPLAADLSFFLNNADSFPALTSLTLARLKQGPFDMEAMSPYSILPQLLHITYAVDLTYELVTDLLRQCSSLTSLTIIGPQNTSHLAHLQNRFISPSIFASRLRVPAKVKKFCFVPYAEQLGSQDGLKMLEIILGSQSSMPRALKAVYLPHLWRNALQKAATGRMAGVEFFAHSDIVVTKREVDMFVKIRGPETLEMYERPNLKRENEQGS